MKPYLEKATCSDATFERLRVFLTCISLFVLELHKDVHRDLAFETPIKISFSLLEKAISKISCQSLRIVAAYLQA